MTYKEHLVVENSPFGEICYVQIRRKKRPAGLRKPYEYILSIQEFNDLFADLKTYCKEFEKDNTLLLKKKPVSKGVRLSLWMMSAKSGVRGYSGMSRVKWREFNKNIQKIIWKFLGKDARIFNEPYSTKQTFNMEFETYIAFKEFLS